MIEYKYNEKDRFVPDLFRPIRVGDVGLTTDKTHSFVVRSLLGNDRARVSWTYLRNNTPHCTNCETGFGCEVSLYVNEYSRKPQNLHWLVKPKNTILIYNKGAQHGG